MWIADWTGWDSGSIRSELQQMKTRRCHKVYKKNALCWINSFRKTCSSSVQLCDSIDDTSYRQVEDEKNSGGRTTQFHQHHQTHCSDGRRAYIQLNVRSLMRIWAWIASVPLCWVNGYQKARDNWSALSSFLRKRPQLLNLGLLWRSQHSYGNACLRMQDLRRSRAAAT